MNLQLDGKNVVITRTHREQVLCMLEIAVPWVLKRRSLCITEVSQTGVLPHLVLCLPQMVGLGSSHMEI